MSGSPEQRQVFDFLKLEAKGTPFEKEFLENDIRDWFKEVNKRQQQGGAVNGFSAQLSRVLGLGGQQNNPTTETLLEAFKARLKPTTSNTVKEFIAFGVREGLYTSVANSLMYVGNVSKAQDIIPFGQKPGGEGIVERYIEDEQNPYAFEYQLTVPYVNAAFGEDLEFRSNPNELTITYKIKVTLPADYDFNNASIERIQYTIEQYELAYTDHHGEELLFAKRSESPKPREIPGEAIFLDQAFFRFTSGGLPADERIPEHIVSLEKACSFLGFFHQAMVYKQPDGHIVFVTEPFEVDQKEGSKGKSENLKEILRFCKDNKIDAEVISSIAEKSYTPLTQASQAVSSMVSGWLPSMKLPTASVRQHFVTYHYTIKPVDIDVELSTSGFETENQTLILGKCYDSKKRLPLGFSTDAQAILLQELGLEQHQVTREYIGVQSNDVDCGYWSCAAAEALLHQGSVSVKDYLKQPLTAAHMRDLKKFATDEAGEGQAINLAERLKDLDESEQVAVMSASPASTSSGYFTPPAFVQTLDESDESEEEFEEFEEAEIAAVPKSPKRLTDKSSPTIISGLLLKEVMSLNDDFNIWKLDEAQLLQRVKVRDAGQEIARSASMPAPEAPLRAVLSTADLAEQAAVQQQVTLQALEAHLDTVGVMEPSLAPSEQQVTSAQEADEVEHGIIASLLLSSVTQVEEAKLVEEARAQAEEQARLEKAAKQRATSVRKEVEASADRARYALLGLVDAIVEQRKKDLKVPTKEEVAAWKRSPINLPISPVRPPVRPITPPAPVVPPKKPGWFAGWELRHFVLAAGLVLMALTIILIPFIHGLWKKLQSNIAENLRNKQSVLSTTTALSAAGKKPEASYRPAAQDVLEFVPLVAGSSNTAAQPTDENGMGRRHSTSDITAPKLGPN